MGFTQTYKPLFVVWIMHHYFLDVGTRLFDSMDPAERNKVTRDYDVRMFMEIYPTEACSRILSGHHLIYRNTPWGLIVGTPVTPSGADLYPSFSLEDDLRFTFAFRITDPNFTNYTALPLIPAQPSIYFFTNRRQDALKRFPHLVRFPGVFQAGETYSSGDILANDANNPTQLFMARRRTASAPPHGDWFNDPLLAGTALQYVTRNDRIPVYGDVLRFNTGEAGLQITATATDRWGNTFTPPVDTVTSDDKSLALVDIHMLPEDLLKFKLEDPAKPYTKEFSFYRVARQGSVDGIIELVVKSDDDTYSMIGNNGLVSPDYVIRFKNRSTLWRYRGEDFGNAPTAGPHPLTRFGTIPVTVKNEDNKDVADLPNPGISMVLTEYPPNDPQHYNVISEIFIN